MVEPPDPKDVLSLAQADLAAITRGIMDRVRLDRRPMSEATKRKLSAVMKAKGPMPEATKRKIAAAVRAAAANRPRYPLKREFTKAHRAALSKAQRARGPMSYATRAKIQQALKGRHLAAATKEKIRLSKLGQPRANKDRPDPPLSPENQRRSDAAKAAWVLRKLEKQHGGRIPAWLLDDPEVAVAYETLNTQRSLNRPADEEA